MREIPVRANYNQNKNCLYLLTNYQYKLNNNNYVVYV